MKSPLIIFLAVLASINITIAENNYKPGEGAPLPEKGFKDFNELRVWASNTTIGGGKSNKLKIGGRDVYNTGRMFSSGFSTSELIFYTRVGDTIEPFLRVPTQVNKQHKIKVKGDKIIVMCYNRKAKEWLEAMTISSWMLPYK